MTTGPRSLEMSFNPRFFFFYLLLPIELFVLCFHSVKVRTKFCSENTRTPKFQLCNCKTVAGFRESLDTKHNKSEKSGWNELELWLEILKPNLCMYWIKPLSWETQARVCQRAFQLFWKPEKVNVCKSSDFVKDSIWNMLKALLNPMLHESSSKLERSWPIPSLAKNFTISGIFFLFLTLPDTLNSAAWRQKRRDVIVVVAVAVVVAVVVACRSRCRHCYCCRRCRLRTFSRRLLFM